MRRWGRPLAAALVACVWASLAFPSPQAQQAAEADSARNWLAQGQRALGARDFAEAKRSFAKALRADPDLGEAYLGLGIAEFQTGKNDMAIQHYRRAAQLMPGSFSAHYNLALACLRGNELQEGARELREATRIDPRHADAAYNLGMVLLELKQPNEAETMLRKARTLGAAGPDVVYNLIRAELAAGLVDDALREVRQSPPSLGEDANWQEAVGKLLLDNQLPKDAAERFARALQLKPGSIEIQRQLAAARLGNFNAEGVLAALPAPASAEDHFLRASAYILLRRYPDADRESRRALAQQPADARFLLLQARIDQRLGNHGEALELLQRASEVDPGWPEPYYSAGVTYYLERRYEDARRNLARALELEPKSSRVLFLYAATLVNQGRNREGETYLRQAIGLEPRNSRFQYHLGALLLRDNRPDEAHSVFEKSIDLDPEFAPAHYQLGKMLARSNHLAEAAKELEAAIKFQPDLASAYYQLGRVYEKLGDRAKAQEALQVFQQIKKSQSGEELEFGEEVRRELSAQ